MAASSHWLLAGSGARNPRGTTTSAARLARYGTARMYIRYGCTDGRNKRTPHTSWIAAKSSIQPYGGAAWTRGLSRTSGLRWTTSIGRDRADMASHELEEKRLVAIQHDLQRVFARAAQATRSEGLARLRIGQQRHDAGAEVVVLRDDAVPA